MTRITPALRRATALVAGSAVAAGGCYAVLGASTGNASSHREAPLIAGDPVADNTDTYAFVSPDAPDTVTLIANWYPNQEPAGGPNFYPWAESDEALYYIKLDTDGDAVADITYEWAFTTIDARGDVDYPDTDPPTVEDPGDAEADGSFLYNNGPVESFDDATLLFKQTYDLTAIDGAGVRVPLFVDQPVAPSRVGDASMPNYEALRDEAVVTGAGDAAGLTSFVGQAEDPFFLDLRAFDLLYGGDLSEVGYDTLARYNVNSVALQVPIELLTDPDAPTDPVVGIWSTTDRASITTRDVGAADPSGDFVQVSRLGNPLVNELVLSAPLKDTFNSIPPDQDATVADGAAVAKVLDPELPTLLNAIYGLDITEEDRSDLLAIFLTGLNGLNQPEAPTASEQLRLNTSIAPSAEPNRLGVLAGDNAGFPNGRRLADDVVDIALQAVAGAVTVDETGAPTGVTLVPALAAGDAVDANQVAFGETFPYLALPISGSAVQAAAPTVTETATATETQTATATTTATVTQNAGARGPRSGAMPRGGIDTGDARSASQLPVALAGAGVLILGLGGYTTVALRKRRAVGLHR